MGYVFAREVGYVSRFSHVQTLRVSCTVTVRFIEVGGYVIWHLHKTAIKKRDPASGRHSFRDPTAYSPNIESEGEFTRIRIRFTLTMTPRPTFV